MLYRDKSPFPHQRRIIKIIVIWQSRLLKKETQKKCLKVGVPIVVASLNTKKKIRAIVLTTNARNVNTIALNAHIAIGTCG